MRQHFKRVASRVLMPLTRWYLRKERLFSRHDITVAVPTGVFHPGLFHSTNFLIDYLLTQNIRTQSLLELGCGSGLISLVAAKNGAVVTASDLSKAAIDAVTRNAAANNLNIRIVHSDLFDAMPHGTFDWIIVNPPYYARAIGNESELAWHCGENFGYFRKFFSTLHTVIRPSTSIVMVLTQGCDQATIFQIGNAAGYKFEKISERDVLFDGKDFLYRIKKGAD